MEKVVIIKEVGEYKERQYEGRNGQTEVFRSKGFVMQGGGEEFYGEMVGESASRNRDKEYSMQDIYVLRGSWKHRTWQTKEGENRHENWLVIDVLEPLK